mmetsp:Transcript_31892/g.44626  ORF Transcript_31892/g.44626 Transcript_31892/m.44626 type:complete len:710 (+) Transcript_31892:188-2317(+)
MKVSHINGVKIYHCSAGKTLPQWFDNVRNVAARKESLRYNEAYRRRIELIHDFHFPTAANTLKISPDGEFILACGTYKPQLKMYELSQLSMKFERHMDAQGVACSFLGDDYRKFAMLREDRFIEFHAQYGLHHKLRVPKFGRDMCYLRNSCDLLVGGASSEIYRLNLFRGEFLAPFSSALKGVNAIAENRIHGLVAAAGEDGKLECFDPRNGKRVAYLRVAESLARVDARAANDVKEGKGISAVAFGSALTMGVGTSSGHVLLYDLRAPAPLTCRDHRYGMPIKRLIFQQGKGGEERLLSADSKVIKIWHGENKKNKLLTSIEPPADLNDFVVYKDSGMVLAACEAHRMHTWYVPAMGAAPKWCYYLDTLTEELEESRETTVYEDYKFVTREQLEQWGVADLIGTEALRPYMHGFFIDVKLYKRIQSVADPYAYERFYQEKLRKKIEETRASRINITSQLPKVNRKLAKAILQHRSQRLAKKEAKKDGGGDDGNDNNDDDQKASPNGKLVTDLRFKALFEDEDFEIDETSEHYSRLNPHRYAAAVKRAEADEDEGMVDGGNSDADSDEDLRIGALSMLGKAEENAMEMEHQQDDDSSSDNYDDEDNVPPPTTTMFNAPSGYSARHLLERKASTQQQQQELSELTLEQRLRLHADSNNYGDSDYKSSTQNKRASTHKAKIDSEHRLGRKNKGKCGGRKKGGGFKKGKRRR